MNMAKKQWVKPAVNAVSLAGAQALFSAQTNDNVYAGNSHGYS